MARLIDENFEGNGYEESWTETVSIGNTLDEDSAIPGTPPVGSNSQCLKAIFTSGATYAYAARIIGNNNIVYIRGYIYLSEEGLNDNQLIQNLVLSDSSSLVCGRIDIAQIAGVLQIRFSYYSAGAVQSTAFVNFSLNTWYRIEFQYDITNLLWEWRIDGITKNSGSLSAATRTPNGLLIGTVHTGSAQSTLYTDLVVWDDTTWVGDVAIKDIIGGGFIMFPR